MRSVCVSCEKCKWNSGDCMIVRSEECEEWRV